MKTRLLILAFAVLFLSSEKNTFAQNSGLSVKLTKTAGNIYAVNDSGKHVVSFEISGIESQKHADNLLKSVRGYRGVEEFNLSPMEGTNNWKAEGVFYKYAKDDYFKFFFKFMKVSKVLVNNEKIEIDNL